MGRTTKQPTHLEPEAKPKALNQKELVMASENCLSYTLQCALHLAAGKPLRRNGELLTLLELDKIAQEFEAANTLIREIKATLSLREYADLMRRVQEHKGLQSSLPASSVPYPDVSNRISAGDIIVALKHASGKEMTYIKQLLK